jgi:hypothetical protein
MLLVGIQTIGRSPASVLDRENGLSKAARLRKPLEECLHSDG